MSCSLGGLYEEVLKERVLQTPPDFSSLKYHGGKRDRFICEAPIILGQLIALKEKLRVENKAPGFPESLRESNLFAMRMLDLYIKAQAMSCAPDLKYVHAVQVTARGSILIPERFLESLAA